MQARGRRSDPGRLHRVVVTRETHTRINDGSIPSFPAIWGNANGWQLAYEANQSGRKAAHLALDNHSICWLSSKVERRLGMTKVRIRFP